MLRDVDVITTDQKYMGRETEYRSANNHLPDADKVWLQLSAVNDVMIMAVPGIKHTGV